MRQRKGEKGGSVREWPQRHHLLKPAWKSLWIRLAEQSLNASAAGGLETDCDGVDEMGLHAGVGPQLISGQLAIMGRLGQRRGEGRLPT